MWKDAKRAASEAEDIFAAAVIARDEAFEVYVALKNERKLKKRKLTEGDDNEWCKDSPVSVISNSFVCFLPFTISRNTVCFLGLVVNVRSSCDE